MLNRTEEQIINSWTNKQNCLVSIVCITYNHEKYIQKTIDSFLMQQSDFIFEILIHDDASTDNTARIIKEYHTKYPNLIKTILQKTNMVSQGGFNPATYTASQAKGEFIAYCEGDDYWTATDKLAQQVAALRRHPTCDICFHPAFCFDDSNANNQQVVNQYSKREHIFSLDEVIKGGGGFCPSASLMLKKQVFTAMPDWILDAPMGDYYYQVLASKRGGIIYLPDIMSAYRYAGAGSMTTATGRHNRKQIKQFVEKDMKALDILLPILGDQYKTSINWRRAAVYTGASFIPLGQGDFKTFKELIEESWRIQQKITRIQSVVYTMRNFPLLLMLLLKIKRRLFFSARFYGMGWGLPLKQ